MKKERKKQTKGNNERKKHKSLKDFCQMYAFVHWSECVVEQGYWTSDQPCFFCVTLFLFLLSHFNVATTLESYPALLLSFYKVHQNVTFEKCLPLLALLWRLPTSYPSPRPASQFLSIFACYNDKSTDAVIFAVGDVMSQNHSSSINCFWHVHGYSKIDYTFKLVDQYACVGHKLLDSQSQKRKQINKLQDNIFEVIKTLSNLIVKPKNDFFSKQVDWIFRCVHYQLPYQQNYVGYLGTLLMKCWLLFG